LDRHFKRTFKVIEKNSKTDEEAQRSFLQLFTLRNIIEAGTGDEAPAAARLAETRPLFCQTAKTITPSRSWQTGVKM
jgi:hypothetical protein